MGFKNLEHNIGVNVNATKVETSTPVDTTMPKDLKNLAAMPSIKKTTVNRATNTRVDATIGKNTSLAPLMLAAYRSGFDLFIFRFRCEFSRTTIASSTTTPINSSRPSIVIVFNVSPKTYIIKIEPNKETGMVAPTIAILEKLLRKMSTIKAANMVPAIKFCPKPLIKE